MAKAKPTPNMGRASALMKRQHLIRDIMNFPAWSRCYTKLRTIPTATLASMLKNLRGDEDARPMAQSLADAGPDKLTPHMATNRKLEVLEAKLRDLRTNAQITCSNLENLHADLCAGHVRTAKLAINWIVHNLAAAVHASDIKD